MRPIPGPTSPQVRRPPHWHRTCFPTSVAARARLSACRVSHTRPVLVAFDTTESIVPVLVENSALIELKPAKATGLGMTQLGVPVLDGTQVKKGTLHEFLQSTGEGTVGRRYQNIRVTAVRTTEGGVESAKVFVAFEVFGDDNVPEGANGGFAGALLKGDDVLLALPVTPLFLPYGRAWYENQAVFDVPLAVFDGAERLQFTARADSIRAI